MRLTFSDMRSGGARPPPADRATRATEPGLVKWKVKGPMRSRKRLTLLLLSSLAVLSLLGGAFVFHTASTHAASSGFTRSISAAGVSSFASAQGGSDAAVQDPEFATAGEGDTAGAGGANNGPNRSLSGPTKGNGRAVNADAKAKSNPELNRSFDGLNFFNQRFANGGNQFSVEPPDQGMCAGNGFVVESVNDVLRVFHTDGTAATGVVDLNTFYGYIAAIDRTHLVQGPFVTDPSCLFDQTTHRFVNVVLTLEVKPTAPHRGAFLGPNHLDIAVSNTSDPTGAWTIYRLPVQDDGTQGTPDHQCVPDSAPPPSYRTNPNACIGDYPHIGADANGFYIETNEYDLFGNGYHGSQIYAISNAQLASLPASLNVTQFDTAHSAPGGKPGFTIWPAQSSAGQFNADNGGTEFFLSSNAADEAQCDSEAQGCSGTGTSNQIITWSLTNTSSLSSASPSLTLSNSSVTVDQYAIPPKSDQPNHGDWPQGQCLNIPACATNVLLGVPDPFTEVISHLDSNDTRMQQVTYANGKLWGALDTAITVGGANKASIEYFVVNPNSSKLALQGTLAVANNNLTYPAIGVLPNGRGVIAFTVVGADHFASAGYAAINAVSGAGAVHIAAEGVGLDDGFTSYKAQVGDPPRTRWGDYGAAAVDGNTIWIASEYIGQSCSLTQWLHAPLGRCGNTRGALGNWGTRISNVTP
jgi:hypothetical protein